jgi:hypothetical protein
VSVEVLHSSVYSGANIPAFAERNFRVLDLARAEVVKLTDLSRKALW